MASTGRVGGGGRGGTYCAKVAQSYCSSVGNADGRGLIKGWLILAHTKTSESISCSKGFALTWYRALTGYSSPAQPFAAPDVPLLVTGQQGSPSPACLRLSRARNACAESSREESTKLGHGTKLGRALCYPSYASLCIPYGATYPNPGAPGARGADHWTRALAAWRGSARWGGGGSSAGRWGTASMKVRGSGKCTRSNCDA